MMKLNAIKAILLLVTCIGYSTLHAQRQRRTCDIVPFVTAPTDTVINGKSNGNVIPLKLSFGNRGPDKLVTGDAFLFVVYTLKDGQKTVIHSNLAAGEGNDSIPFETLAVYERTFNFTIPGLTEPMQLDLCVEVNSEGIVNGDSLVLAYYDPDKGNNIACNTLTVLPEGTTSIVAADGEDIRFLIYPNPTRDKLYIQSGHKTAPDATQVVVRDITGRVLYQQTYTTDQAGPEPVMINVERFPAGMYTISLQTGADIATRKFTVKK